MKNDRYTEQQLDEAIARLPREIPPERDLWTQLEPHLPERGGSSTAGGRGVGHRWAAVLVLGLAGLLGWRLLLVPMPGSESPDALLVTQEPAEAIGEPFDHWQRHLAIWDEAIARVRTGLEHYPEEPVLLAQLESLYQQQMNYLQLVSDIETSHY